MLKYEEKFHLDQHYKMLQSNSALRKSIAVVWGVIGYILLYLLIKYVLLYIPDVQPWNDLETWFTLSGISFVRADLVYFLYGLIMTSYGTVKLPQISVQNHSVKNKNSNKPKKLLVNGYYTKVRHPMYGTFIILQAGLMMSLRSLDGMIIALLIIISQYINATIEEKNQLVPTFGEEYKQYSKKVKAMILTKLEIIIFSLVIIFSIIGFKF